MVAAGLGYFACLDRINMGGVKDARKIKGGLFGRTHIAIDFNNESIGTS